MHAVSHIAKSNVFLLMLKYKVRKLPEGKIEASVMFLLNEKVLFVVIRVDFKIYGFIT